MKSLMLVLVAFALSGCTTANLSSKLSQFEKLGITEAHITGKFSNTDYQVTKEGGKRTAVLQHSNAWVPKVVIVRVTEE